MALISIEIKSVKTPLETAHIGGVIKNARYYALEKTIEEYNVKNNGLAGYNFDLNRDLDVINKILYYPEEYKFEVYCNDILFNTICSKEFSVKYK
jgi:hypothetical protein